MLMLGRATQLECVMGKVLYFVFKIWEIRELVLKELSCGAFPDLTVIHDKKNIFHHKPVEALTHN